MVEARIPATSTPSEAAREDARARRKSPARMATMFDQRWLTLSTPRRVDASSMTSSWYSDPRCTSSTATAPVTTSSETGSPGPAAYPAHRARAGRIRLPPAPMRWEATSVRNGSPVWTELRRAASTRTRSSASQGSPSTTVMLGRVGGGAIGNKLPV